jgi:hypothetical protein
VQRNRRAFNTASQQCQDLFLARSRGRGAEVEILVAIPADKAVLNDGVIGDLQIMVRYRAEGGVAAEVQ